MLAKENLYHYTKFEPAVKILSSGEVLFGGYEGLNDINECCGPEVIATKTDYSEIEPILTCYRQISFSTDVRGKRGFDNPPMWGHYSDSGKGVCLAFDKSKIIDIIRQNTRLYSKEVEYSDTTDLNLLNYARNKYGNAEDYIRSAKDELFFRKKRDWSYENEYRIITFGEPAEQLSLNIRDCLTGIILFSRIHKQFLESAETKALAKIAGESKLYRYVSYINSYALYNYKGKKIEPKELHYDLSKIITSDKITL